jgi:uncharacterized protein YheU (UPF0270 family)
MIIVPHTQLSPQALTGLIEEFVSRDGTELTDADAKIAQVRAHIESGRAVITYDEETGTCNVVSADHLHSARRARSASRE